MNDKKPVPAKEVPVKKPKSPDTHKPVVKITEEYMNKVDPYYTCGKL